MNVQSDLYKEIGQNIIKELFPELSEMKIAWLSSDKEKKTNGKIVFGECEKVPERYKWCCPFDFTITIYEPNVEGFTEEQIKILLEHEIMHVGTDGKIVPHDIEDFMSIIKKYGFDWHHSSIDYALLE